MTTHQPDHRRIFLAHRAHDAPGYRANLNRLHLLAAGLHASSPGLILVHALGRTPEDDPATDRAPSVDCLQTLARRLILGDDRQATGPQATSCCPRAEAVWIVSDPDATVSEQASWALAASLPVAAMDPEEQDALCLLGGLASLRGLRDWEGEGDAGSVGAAGLAGADDDTRGPADFRGPVDVVMAYFCGAERVLGVQALPLARLQRSGGNPYGRQQAIEQAGIRIAFADTILRRAMASTGWCDEMLTVLRVVLVEGRSCRKAAELAGLGDDDSAERQAGRLRDRALGIVRGCMGA